MIRRESGIRISIREVVVTTADVVATLRQLADDERLEVFKEFCVHCGTEKLPCYCSKVID